MPQSSRRTGDIPIFHALPPELVPRSCASIEAAKAGLIIFRPSNRQPLFRISESGGEAAPLTRLNEALGENSHRGPTFLPDGRRFLFPLRCAVAANNTLYLGSLDSPEPGG